MNSDKDLKNKALSGIIWSGSERVIAQLVSAIVGIILARILIPEDYGVVSIVTIFFSFCNVFICGGLCSALVQKKESDFVDYSTILFANMIMAVVFYIIMFLCAPYIALVFEKQILVPVIRVMSLSFFINGYRAVVGAKISSDLEFKKFFYSTLAGTLISAVIGITMAICGFGAWALVAQQMTNNFVDALILTFTSKIKFICSFSFSRFKKLFSFGGRIMISSLVNESYKQLKPLIVGLSFSSIDLAYYDKGRSYPDLITSTSNDTLALALFPTISKVQDDKESVLNITRRFMQLSSFIMFPTMFGLLAVSEAFVRIVLTDKWIFIVPYIMIFCVSDMLQPIQTGNLQAIRAIGRSDVILKLEIIKKSLYLIILLLFILFSNNPIMLAFSSVITSALASVINSVPNHKLLGYTSKQQVEDLGLNFLLSAFMGACVYLVKFLPFNIYIIFALQLIIGIFIYIFLNIIFRNKSLYYAADLFNLFIKKEKKL